MEKANAINIIPAVIKIEHELALLDENEQIEYLDLLGMDEPVLNKIILAGYKLLNLETFLPLDRKNPGPGQFAKLLSS